ncbi:MAG TPA: NADH-quinone oxidoreductase subunit J [Mycobacteriales bacterium]|nr:NADH-quinone oxidoreductase subunit J [Mycobacteriales bacterium]
MSGTLAAAAELSTGETVIFWILGPLALAGAFGTVLARNAIHSALFLVLTMACLGAFYFVQEAPFLGAVQIIVYTGAIMILFLFVLMLVGRDSSDSIVETLRGQRAAATVLGLGFAGLAAGAIYSGLHDTPMAGLARANADGGNVVGVARLLFTKYLFAFELTSALLITAAVGAMVLAHVEREPGQKRTQRQLARQRLRSGRPQPLPGPGVFATGDSVATPALLPDGSVAPDSVSRLVEPSLPEEPGLGIQPALERGRPGAGRTAAPRSLAGEGPDVPGTSPAGPTGATGIDAPRGTTTLRETDSAGEGVER